MTKRLEQAFAEASKLPEQEQDTLAKWLLEELNSEHEWEKVFARSQDSLAKLGKEALAEHRAGRTQELDPERL